MSIVKLIGLLVLLFGLSQTSPGRQGARLPSAAPAQVTSPALVPSQEPEVEIWPQVSFPFHGQGSVMVFPEGLIVFDLAPLKTVAGGILLPSRIPGLVIDAGNKKAGRLIRVLDTWTLDLGTEKFNDNDLETRFFGLAGDEKATGSMLHLEGELSIVQNGKGWTFTVTTDDQAQRFVYRYEIDWQAFRAQRTTTTTLASNSCQANCVLGDCTISCAAPLSPMCGCLGGLPSCRCVSPAPPPLPLPPGP